MHVIRHAHHVIKCKFIILRNEKFCWNRLRASLRITGTPLAGGLSTKVSLDFALQSSTAKKEKIFVHFNGLFWVPLQASDFELQARIALAKHWQNKDVKQKRIGPVLANA